MPKNLRVVNDLLFSLGSSSSTVRRSSVRSAPMPVSLSMALTGRSRKRFDALQPRQSPCGPWRSRRRPSCRIRAVRIQRGEFFHELRDLLVQLAGLLAFQRDKSGCLLNRHGLKRRGGSSLILVAAVAVSVGGSLAILSFSSLLPRGWNARASRARGYKGYRSKTQASSHAMRSWLE